MGRKKLDFCALTILVALRMAFESHLLKAYLNKEGGVELIPEREVVVY